MQKQHISLKNRINYYFDGVLSRGTPALIALLGIVFFMTAFVTAIFLSLAEITFLEEGGSLNFFEAYWQSLMHVLDQGTVTGDEGWGLRIIMFVATICGIFLVSSLVSILNSGFSTKIEEMRKGRSIVLEEGHTIILGWSSKIFTIISELVLANENQKKSCIVILAEMDKTQMEDEIKEKLGSTGRTKVICRHGNPKDLIDLRITNLNYAKSVIILSPEEMKSDAYVIKSILAIINNPDRKKEKYNIIAEIKNHSNKELAKIVGKDELTVIITNEIISKITVQTSRQSGLSLIYNDLLDYQHIELYILPVKNAKGNTYREIMLGFEDELVVGIKTRDGQVLLNPHGETRVNEGDRFILIAEDDDEFEYVKKPYQIDESAILEAKTELSQTIQHTLILGWNSDTPIILRELDNYVTEGSDVLIVAESDTVEAEVEATAKNIVHQKVRIIRGDINERSMLNTLPFDAYDHIIIVSYSDRYDVQEADAITLITLMHIRDIVAKMNRKFSIVSEMLDSKNRALADLNKADDFIVSEQINSLILAQLSENKELADVFEDLFDADGNEIYLHEATMYVKPNYPVNFFTVIESALRKGQTAIGYRLMRNQDDPNKYYGITLAPHKSDKVSFEVGDKIIVISEN